ncbi:MAG: adenylate kinase [Bacteroidetes bacterium]|nr:adenylate kinase [Bacteroidota bacterium]MCZ6692502.1 adenylate kinase [Bacteroidota bacterium]
MLNLVLFGPPGAGKGTQSDKVIEKYHLTHLSTGDLLRKHISEGTALGKLAQKYTDEGNLVPDQVVIDMVDQKMQDTLDTNGFIFDGFPRTVKQAEALDELMNKNNSPISGMVSLEVPDQELKNRILERGKTSGRADDQDIAKIENRIQVYKDETLPVVNYYQNQQKYFNIHGVGGIDDIFNKIIEVLDRLPT